MLVELVIKISDICSTQAPVISKRPPIRSDLNPSSSNVNWSAKKGFLPRLEALAYKQALPSLYTSLRIACRVILLISTALLPVERCYHRDLKRSGQLAARA